MELVVLHLPQQQVMALKSLAAGKVQGRREGVRACCWTATAGHHLRPLETCLSTSRPSLLGLSLQAATGR